MSDTTKITPASTLANKPRLASIPPMLVTLRDYLQEALQPLLRTLFEKTDDQFFELAEKARMDAEQRIYLNTKKEIRSKRRAVEASYLAMIGEVFHLVPEAITPDAKNEAEKRLDSITANAPMFSVLVAFDSIVEKANTRLHSSLENINKQINKLLPEYTLDKYNSPMGVYMVTQCFLWACENLAIEPEERAIVLNLFDKYVLNDFDKILTKANSLLLDGEISSLAHAKTGGGDNEQINKTQTPALRKKASEETVRKQNKDYQEKKHKLLNVLSKLQKAFLTEVSDKKLDDISKLLKEIPRKLNIEDDSELDYELQQAISLIQMLTEFVLSESTSPDLPAWMNQLYIPFLKAALIDITVFSSSGHAVRRLLNEIAKASADVQPDSSVENDLYRKHIAKVIDRIGNEFDQDLSIFPELLVDFKSVIDDERQRQAIINARLGKEGTSTARSEKAQAAIDKAVLFMSKGKKIPAEVMEFLYGPWQKVLMLAYLAEGDKSIAWISAVQTAKGLIESALPENKKSFLNRLPELLKALASGLTSAGFSPTDIRNILAKLEALHLQRYKSVRKSAEKRLRAKSKIPSLEDVAEQEESPPTSISSDDVTIAQLISTTEEKVETLEDKHAQAVQCVSELTAETWLEFYPEANQKKRVKIAVILYPSHKFIFVDREGKKILEKTNDEVIAAIEQGVLKLLDADSAFGKALAIKR